MQLLIRTVKEAVRHCAHRMGLRRPLSRLAGDPRARFAAIYDEGLWSGNLAGVPPSGRGSSLAATKGLRSALPELLKQLRAASLLDIGCGDFTWMGTLDLPCRYVGIDIVPALIGENDARHGSATRRFIAGNALTMKLPQADVVLCREVLFHLALDDGLALLRNILAAGPRYLLLTSDDGTAFNADIETGDYRLLNLRRRPFRLPAPTHLIRDDAVVESRWLGVWAAGAVAAALTTIERASR